ncbi:MAG: glycosyltransferase family 4 protein [Bacteriovoracaceae bacterium]|jgi:glycosyltransferase involved in cell wall biosynthesis|nr:glycosyltransferase family 4 protein [Bacteriovoracaceae bacterium]
MYRLFREKVENMIKILYITSRSDIGGGPKHLYDLVRYISKNFKQEFEVHIAAPIERPFWEKYETICTNLIAIPKRKFSILSYFNLLSYCKNQNIKLIHSHGRGAGVYSRLLKLFGLNIVHTFHGVHTEKGIIAYIKILMDKFLKLLTDRFISVSLDEQFKAIHLNIASMEDIQTINNGIDSNKVLNYINTQNKTISKKVEFCTLARFDYAKGLDILIGHILKLPSDILAKVHFTIAGLGNETNRFQSRLNSQKLKDSVTLIPETNNPLQLLYNSDVYLSSSRYEGLPLSVLEAMACNKPCLLSDVIGHNSFKKNNTALFFKLSNHEAFKDGIVYFTSSENRIKYGTRSIELVQQYFSIKQMAEDTVQLYRDMVKLSQH